MGCVKFIDKEPKWQSEQIQSEIVKKMPTNS